MPKDLSQFTLEELQAEVKKRYLEEDKSNAQIIEEFSNKVHSKGFRSSDFKVIIDCEDKRYGPYYQFELKIGDKYRDIYYEMPYDGDHKEITHQDVIDFLPDIFGEAAENMYDCDWTQEEVENLFKSCNARIEYLSLP